MRFLIDAPQRSSGLRVVPEIPDFPICRLEGSNGVGKTLAVHLLELATGQQPFARYPLAWQSLSSALGPVTIQIQNLPADPDIIVRLDPDLWNPDSPLDPQVTIGVAECDGRTLTLEEVGRIVRVLRISGDETLEDAVRNFVQDDLVATDRVAMQLTQRRARISSDLAQLNEILGAVLPERLSYEETRLLEVDARLKSQVNDLETALERQSHLAMAQSLADQLASTTATVPALERERETLQQQMQAFQRERGELDARRRELEPQLSASRALADQIAKAQSLRRTRVRRLLDLETQAASLSQDNDVAAQRAAVQVALDATQKRMVTLRERIASIDSQGAILGVMDQMTTPLEGARIRGFGDEVIARFDGKFERVFGRPADVRVSDLIGGLNRQRTVISESRQPREVEELKVQLRAAQNSVGSLERLQDLVARRDRAAELLREIDDELRALSSNETGAVATEYRQASDQIAEIDNSIREATVREVELVHRIHLMTGGQSIEEIQNRLSHELLELSLAPSDLPDEFRKHQQRVNELEGAVSQANAELQEVRGLVDAMRSQIRPILSELLELPSYTWLASSLREEVRLAGDDVAQLANVVGRLHAASSRVEQLIEQLVDDVEAIRAALNDLIRMVSSRDASEAYLPRKYEMELRTLFSKRLRDEFAQREVSQALFDSGEVLDVDLARLEVTWRTSDGDIRTRPFEAFSSGERVFAYTRARMEAIASVSAKYRVIVLDEFGAFLARDRLDALVRYIQDAVLGSVAAQVVLVLPLSRPAASVSDSALTDDSAGERYQYFAESAVLSSGA